jgi:hypothetical protein
VRREGEEHVRLGCRYRLVLSRSFVLEEILGMGNVMTILFWRGRGGGGGRRCSFEMMSIKLPSI